MSCAQVVEHVADLADGGFNTYVTDAQRGYEVVLVAGPAAALVLCLVYMVLMRFLAGVVAWGVIVLINLLFVACTVLAAYKSELLGALPALSDLNDLMENTGGTLEGARPPFWSIFGPFVFFSDVLRAAR